MNKLWFVRMDNEQYSPVVYLLTAENEEQAAKQGLAMINPDYVNYFRVVKVEMVCYTPDTIACFEPC